MTSQPDHTSSHQDVTPTAHERRPWRPRGKRLALAAALASGVPPLLGVDTAFAVSERASSSAQQTTSGAPAVGTQCLGNTGNTSERVACFTAGSQPVEVNVNPWAETNNPVMWQPRLTVSQPDGTLATIVLEPGTERTGITVMPNQTLYVNYSAATRTGITITSARERTTQLPRLGDRIAVPQPHQTALGWYTPDRYVTFRILAENVAHKEKVTVHITGGAGGTGRYDLVNGQSAIVALSPGHQVRVIGPNYTTASVLVTEMIDER